MQDEMPELPLNKVQVRHGKKIVLGDKVGLDRENFRDKVGVYIGKNYKRKQLKVHFTEFGGCDVLCYPHELRRLAIVGQEAVSAQDVE